MELQRPISSYCAISIMVSAFGFLRVVTHFLPTPPFQSIQRFVLHLLSATNTSHRSESCHSLRVHAMVSMYKKPNNFKQKGAISHEQPRILQVASGLQTRFTHIISIYSDMLNKFTRSYQFYLGTF